MIGETIGNFEIVSLLGRGGMAEVWLAKHQLVGNSVAIKLLDSDTSTDREQVSRFFNQAQAAGRIQHAGVGQIFDVGYAGERAYLVMEYLPGDTLRRRLRNPLDRKRALELAKQIASVLVATHAANVVHRDLKPENIILVRDPSTAIGERARLVDFGIAKLGDLSLTSTNGPMMGTPLYMSPEQWRNVSKVSPASDTYAFGCMLFEMLCGRTPFLATSTGEACTQHMSDPPPSPRNLIPDLSEPLDALVLQMLDKDPTQRPSMREVEQRLDACARDAPMVPAPASAPVTAMQVTQTTEAPLALDDTRLAPRAPHSRSPEAGLAKAPLEREEPIARTPSPGSARWVVGGVAVLAIGAGIWLVTRSSTKPDATPDAHLPDAPVVTVARDAALEPDAAESKNSMTQTSYSPYRDFLTGKNLPEPLSGPLPRIPRSVSIRVCFDAVTGIVDRVGVSNDAERADPRLGDVIRATVLTWRYAPYQSTKPLVCRALDLRPTITSKQFDAEHPR